MSDRSDPPELVTIDQVVTEAHRVLDPGAWAWAASGAGQGVTAARNSLALNRLALVPRVGRDMSQVDTSTSLCGVPMGLPVFLAPIGALELYDKGDALAAARAAATVSTSVFCSTLTTSSWADVAGIDPGRHFFQLYVFGDRAWVTEVLRRVEAAPFGGLCVTLDIPVIARRDQILEAGYTWRAREEGNVNLADIGFADSYRTRFGWDDLDWICGQTELPVVVKGITHPDDAARALDCGAAAIYVSNHGGRSVDHGLSTIEVLSEVVDRVGTDVDVVIDGGFTRGAEACKALALGARAVGIGRLQCWGLAAGGQAGLARVLEILAEEIADTMANIGCRTVAEISPEYLRWSTPAPPASGDFSEEV